MEKSLLPLLERAGLTRNEARVYLALLEVGPSSTKPIMESTGIHASKVYDSLDRLVHKGLANFIIEANRKRFSATEPESIISFLEEKQADLEDEKAEMKKALPALKSLQAERPAQSATVFQGAKGYKAMLGNMLKELEGGGSYDAFASGMLREILGSYWFQFQRKKKTMKVRSRCIWEERVRQKSDYLEEYYGTGMFIPDGLYRSPADFFIYNDKVILASYSQRPVFAVLIQSEGMASGYRELFNALWKSGKK
ncbi:MAG: helix-turn-helix domain-containing protein [Candidatus Micrarchaeia archaeon]